ncbi:MAG TPA: tetratricopeptide repeat protein, partial [Polyangiaceae bacterium]|nr:tetratricopeptide repeat protein [Polyangiaceae bacterium]
MMRKLRARSLLCLSISCLCVLSSSLVSAAPPAAHASSDDDATVAMARDRFKEGVSYFDQKQYDKARAAFLQAYALKKHPAVLLNLAQSELRSGHEADAANHFAAYLREAKDASEAEKQAADAGLTAAKVVVAEIDVSVDERAAEIYLDGTLQGNSPLPGAIYVAPGSHTVEARKDGKTASSQLNAIAGKHMEAELEFAPKPAPKAAPAPAEENANADIAPEPVVSSGGGRKPFFKWLVTSPVGLVGLGLTVVGSGGGIGFALAAKKSYKNADSVASEIMQNAALDTSPNPNTSSLCLGPSAWLEGHGYHGTLPIQQRAPQYSDACNTYQNDVHNGDTMKTVATVGFVVAGVAAVGTVVYYFVDP